MAFVLALVALTDMPLKGKLAKLVSWMILMVIILAMWAFVYMFRQLTEQRFALPTNDTEEPSLIVDSSLSSS